MSLTDFLALEPVAAAGPRVVAGASNLDREVRWAHVFETREIAFAITGGEVLLTTGIELAQMAATEVEELVGELVDREICALAIELGSVLTEAPPALVAAADRRGLPVIVFQRGARFVTITQLVAERRLAGEVARLRRAVDVQSRLRAAAQQGLGPEGIVSALAASLDAQVLLERADGVPIASAPEDGLDDRFLAGLDAFRARKETPLWTRRVQVPGRAGARLHVLPRNVGGLERLAVEEGAFVLAVALAAQPEADEVASGDRGRLVRRLAEGRAASSADVLRRARSAGIDLSRAVLVAVVARGVQGVGPLESVDAPTLVEHAAGRRARALVGIRGDAPHEEVRTLFAALVHRRAPSVDAIGVSIRGGEPWELKQAFAEADRAALVGQVVEPRLRWADELAGLGPVAAAVLSGEQVAPPLEERDERLLDALVNAGFAVAPAARRLGIARQTLYAELKRAEERFGVDPLRPQAHAELSLRLLCHRMQRRAEAEGSSW